MPPSWTVGKMKHDFDGTNPYEIQGNDPFFVSFESFEI